MALSKHYKPKGSIVAALDIGSSKTACFIARIIDDEGGFEILGVGHRSANGIKSGTIIDLDAAGASIRETVHAAENMAADITKSYPLREVIVNVPGIHAQSHARSVDIDIGSQKITDNDIRTALSEAQEQMRSSEAVQELVHTIPVGYRLDGHSGIVEPRGMVAEQLGLDVHLVSAESGALQNIATCVDQSHLDIEAFCLAPYAAGLSALVEDELDLGCTLIDLGGGVTSFAVFEGGQLLYADAVPVGGRHVTSDIAKVLTTSLSDAERIKVLYGSAIAASTDETELIDVPVIGEDARLHEPNHVPRSLLIGIIQPRFEEIFDLVRMRLQDSGLGGSIGRRVVLTGGASQMAGLRDLAQHVLDKQVRLGKPIRMSGLPDAVSGPAFATTAGLLTYLSERSSEIPAEILARIEPGSLWERVKHWLAENW